MNVTALCDVLCLSVWSVAMLATDWMPYARMFSLHECMMLSVLVVLVARKHASMRARACMHARSHVHTHTHTHTHTRTHARTHARTYARTHARTHTHTHTT